MKTKPTVIITACEEQGLVCVPELGIYDSDGALLLEANGDNGTDYPPEELEGRWWRFGLPGWEKYEQIIGRNSPNNVIAENRASIACDVHPTWDDSVHFARLDDPGFFEALNDLRTYARKCVEAMEALNDLRTYARKCVEAMGEK